MEAITCIFLDSSRQSGDGDKFPFPIQDERHHGLCGARQAPSVVLRVVVEAITCIFLDLSRQSGDGDKFPFPIQEERLHSPPRPPPRAVARGLSGDGGHDMHFLDSSRQSGDGDDVDFHIRALVVCRIHVASAWQAQPEGARDAMAARQHLTGRVFTTPRLLARPRAYIAQEWQVLRGSRMTFQTMRRQVDFSLDD